MAPVPEWIHAVLHHRQVIASNASFTEKAIVLLVAGHILVLYTALCWLGASTIGGESLRKSIEQVELQLKCHRQQTAAIIERPSVSRPSTSSSRETRAGSTLRNTAQAPPNCMFNRSPISMQCDCDTSNLTHAPTEAPKHRVKNRA